MRKVDFATLLVNDAKQSKETAGEILREDVLPAAGLAQDKLARWLGVSRRTVAPTVRSG